MRYSVRLSDGCDVDVLYFDCKEHAKLVFDLAVESNGWEYVSLSEIIEEERTIEEWVEEDTE